MKDYFSKKMRNYRHSGRRPTVKPGLLRHLSRSSRYCAIPLFVERIDNFAVEAYAEQETLRRTRRHYSRKNYRPELS